MFDVLSKFENVKIENETRLSEKDLQFCKEQEEIYKQTLHTYQEFFKQLSNISKLNEEHGQKYGKQSGAYFHKQETAFYYTLKIYDYNSKIYKIREGFINQVCRYFECEHNITINNEIIVKKFKESVTYSDIVEEIFLQLGGFNFAEKAEKEIKENLKELFRHDIDKVVVKGSKVNLNAWFARHDSIWKDYRLNSDRCEAVFKALSHFEDGDCNIKQEIRNLYCGYDNERDQANYERCNIETMSKVKSIKFLKNGKMDIEFESSQCAIKFAKEYCGR
ncbi:hypothetical protein EBB07_29255 [Paenibacillaceae bacterium]|nr:hypothetical protein EBB07_29255 [Paenibacillaceae bacterium]